MPTFDNTLLGLMGNASYVGGKLLPGKA